MTARRSSFFRRHLNSILENSNCDNEKSESPSEDDEIILNHVAKIEQTILDWRSEYWRTKAAYKELEKYKDNVNVIQYNQCKDLLLPEDLKFLNNRFDYTALIRQLENIIMKLEVTKFKMCKMKARMNEKVELLEKAIVELKKEICKYLLECDESADLFATST